MGVSVTFIPDKGGQRRLLSDPSGPYGQWLARIGNRAVSNAKRRANVDTGLMRSRIEFRILTDSGGLVGVLAAQTGYAQYVHRRNPFLTDAVRDTLS